MGYHCGLLHVCKVMCMIILNMRLLMEAEEEGLIAEEKVRVYLSAILLVCI